MWEPGGVWRTALSSSTDTTRAIHSGGDLRAAFAGDWRETLGRGARQRAKVNGLGGWRGRRRIETREPQQIVDKGAENSALVPNAFECLTHGRSIPVVAKAKRRLGLDHRQWRTQLV